jgi:hypothetical protein
MACYLSQNVFWLFKKRSKNSQRIDQFPWWMAMVLTVRVHR